MSRIELDDRPELDMSHSVEENLTQLTRLLDQAPEAPTYEDQLRILAVVHVLELQYRALTRTWFTLNDDKMKESYSHTLRTIHAALLLNQRLRQAGIEAYDIATHPEVIALEHGETPAQFPEEGLSYIRDRATRGF